MKKLFAIALFSAACLFQYQAQAQDSSMTEKTDTKMPEDKSKRPSPPAVVTQKTDEGITITINYSQPSVKGRTIGKDLEPMDGKVWRTGANEATTFTVDKDVNIEGKNLASGTYSLFTIHSGNEWTIIFNKVANQWGAFKYDSTQDALRVNVPSEKADSFSEKMTFSIDDDGTVDLLWGDLQAEFNVGAE
ncbi:MAG: DUF2911 domain-containing protein [Bacteroidetes bacterium]|nr:DUF2911 domain-containing protein [Bacteroidota bacterium]